MTVILSGYFFDKTTWVNVRIPIKVAAQGIGIAIDDEGIWFPSSRKKFVNVCLECRAEIQIRGCTPCCCPLCGNKLDPSQG